MTVVDHVGETELVATAMALCSDASLNDSDQAEGEPTECALVLTTLLLEVPFLANAFGFMPIGLDEYAIAIGLASLVIPVLETVKFFQRKLAK